jgi:hypothetical protein
MLLLPAKVGAADLVRGSVFTAGVAWLCAKAAIPFLARRCFNFIAHFQ